MPTALVCSTFQFSIGSGVNTVFNFDQKIFDNDNMYNSNTKLTINTAGVYLICGNAFMQDNATGYRKLTVRKNGGTNLGIHNMGAVSGDFTRIQVVAVANLIVGDYVELLI